MPEWNPDICEHHRATMTRDLENAVNAVSRDMTLELRHVNTTLIDLTDQVRKTNGRVGSLEKWQFAIKGAVIASSILVPPLTGIIVWVFLTVTGAK